MKNHLLVFAASSLLLLPLGGLTRAQDVPPPPDQGGPTSDQDDEGDDQGASFQNFYDQLGSQGQWIQTDDYGYVFQPNVSDPDWAPYTDGHWVYTDVGWTWVSDEPWGWATYHYGRWANIDGTGWVWIPGYRWAPAWVSWRYGGGYCGWAPLPPETFYGVDYGSRGGVFGDFHFGGDVDVTFNIGPGCYNFVPVNYMGEHNYHGYYVDRSRNYTVINNTTNITNIYNTRGTGVQTSVRGVTVGGPPLAEINAHAATRIQRVALTTSTQAGPARLEGNSLAVYAPHVRATTIGEARPAQVATTLSHPAFNRGDSITRPLAVTASIHPAAPSAEAVQAAEEARAHAPARAKVASETTQPKVRLSEPLTAMQPISTTHHAATSQATAIKPAGNEFTGEVKPAATYHPEANTTVSHATSENTGGEVYHPESSEQVYHAPAPTETHPESVYHPEAAPAFHPMEAPAVEHHEETPSVSHAAATASHPEATASHPEAKTATHPQDEDKDDKKK